MTIALHFEPTGEGRVLCKRARAGRELVTIVYHTRIPAPSLLTEQQEADYHAAWDLEEENCR